MKKYSMEFLARRTGKKEKPRRHGRNQTIEYGIEEQEKEGKYISIKNSSEEEKAIALNDRLHLSYCATSIVL